MDHTIRNPGIPFTSHIHGGFGPGRLVHIQGTIIKPAPHFQFQINFQCKTSNQDEIAFHFNPRSSEGEVVRNTLGRSGWGEEERKGRFPFSQRQTFEITILCEAKQYIVAVNGTYFTTYDHRIPVERVSSFNIRGDVSISCIQFSGVGATHGPVRHPLAVPMGIGMPPGNSSYPYTAPGYPSALPPGYPSASAPGYEYHP